MIYYETQHKEENTQNTVFTSHADLDTAILFSDAHNVETIQQIGGNYSEYKKCWFCGEWFETGELNEDDTCERCEIAIKQHL